MPVTAAEGNAGAAGFTGAAVTPWVGDGAAMPGPAGGRRRHDGRGGVQIDRVGGEDQVVAAGRVERAADFQFKAACVERHGAAADAAGGEDA